MDTSLGVWGDVKGWWVEVRSWVLVVEEEEGVKRGKCVIHRGKKPVRGERKEASTPALWRAKRRAPSGVELPERGLLGRA